MSDLNALSIAWSAAKIAETEAIAQRRAIEDKMAALLDLKETDEGTRTEATPLYTIKITNRHKRKVDSDLIQEIAAEHGLAHLLPSVCRWTPELDMRVWKGLDEKHRAILGAAITTTAGRPSFAITAINHKE